MLLNIFFESGRINAQTTYCGQTVTASITSASMSTLFPGGGSWPSGSIIGVSGTLTVDQSSTFSTIRFIMGSGASIKVQGTGVVLTANTNTTFGPCLFDPTPKMWTGITIQSGAAIVFSDVIVRDAWIGLRFLGGANATGTSILRCNLFNNMYGIGIFSFPLFRPAVFASNTIKLLTGQNILPPPPGQSYSGSKLHRGIWVTSSTVDIATGATLRNFIEGYRYGMWNFGSTVTVANMKFMGQSNDMAVADTLDGTDIYSWRSNLNVGGAGTTNCIFQTADNSGIISKNTLGLFVSGAFFDEPNLYGIRCAQSIALSAPIRILDNKLNMNNGGPLVSAIYVERPPSGPSATNVDIERNTITRNAGHDKKTIIMIDVQGKVPASDITLIKNNPIDIDKKWARINGIRVTGKGKNYHIMDNVNLTWDVDANPTETAGALLSRGIIANDLMDGFHLITGNTITSTLLNDKSYLRAAIFMENNPLSVRVCENITNATFKGIECRGNLGSTFMTKNSMGAAAFGLYCEAGNTMPNQDRQENLWTAASYFNLGAKYNAITPSFRFFYDPSNAITNDVPPNGSFLPATFFQALSGSMADCGGSVEQTNSSGGNITNYERDYINSIIVPNATAINWDTRQRLFYKLLQIPELLTGDVGAANYLYANQTANTSPYCFAYAEHLFDQAYTLTSTQAGQLSVASAQVQASSDQIAVLDAQQAQDTSTYDLSIAQQRATAFDQLSAAAVTLEQLRTQAGPGIQQGLQTAMTYVLALPDTLPYEDNLKDIFIIAIRAAMGDSLIETDFARLRQIAAQCPSVGGISVRRAPQWMLPEERIDYSDKDWDAGCVATYYSKEAEINNSSTLQLAPNPAHDYLQVTFPDKAKGNWKVSDAVGRVVLQGTVDIPTLGLDTRKWLPGFYFLVWQSLDGATSTAKFIISH